MFGFLWQLQPWLPSQTLSHPTPGQRAVAAGDGRGGSRFTCSPRRQRREDWTPQKQEAWTVVAQEETHTQGQELPSANPASEPTSSPRARRMLQSGRQGRWVKARSLGSRGLGLRASLYLFRVFSNASWSHWLLPSGFHSRCFITFRELRKIVLSRALATPQARDKGPADAATQQACRWLQNRRGGMCL